MIVLGIFLILVQNVNENVRTITEGQGLQAFVSDDYLDKDNIEQIARKLKDVENVKEVKYLDKKSK